LYFNFFTQVSTAIGKNYPREEEVGAKKLTLVFLYPVVQPLN